MANLIQIKRSETTANPASLANGELAFSGNGDILFIGSAATVVPIAGKRFPGTLTANQALVANASSYLDQVKTAKLFLTDGTANVTHINAVSNSTVLGTAANTEITTTWAIKTYVDAKTASLGGSLIRKLILVIAEALQGQMPSHLIKQLTLFQLVVLYPPAIQQ
jgi:hypothetical protein